MTFFVCDHEPPSVCRETALSRQARIDRDQDKKKGVHGGNMVSPVLKRPDWVVIPVAGIRRLIEQAAATP
jgi:hypothetical protein